MDVVLGRIIEGLTAGEISTLYAYFADITEPNERTKVFGWMGAFSRYRNNAGSYYRVY